MDGDAAEELDRLRRRAYGPDADIAEDIGAQQRLSQLQDRRSTASETPDAAGSDRTQREAPVTVAVPTGAAASRATSSAAASPESTAGGSASDPSSEHVHAEAPRRASRLRGRGVVGAVGAVLAAFVLGLALGAWWPREAPAPAGAAPDAVLEITSSPHPWLADWDRSLQFWGVAHGSLAPFEPFGELGVWTASTAASDRCLVITTTTDIVAATCASAGLDPVFDLVVGDDVDAAHVGVPDGSVVRFQGGQSDVRVWVRRPAGQVEGSQPSSRAASEPSRA